MNQVEFIPLYPNIKKFITICKFKYMVLEMVLFKHIKIGVYLYNENDVLIESRQFLIEGEEYNNWSNDDQYIIKLLKEKLQN